jgi:hypothetical protein
MEDTRAAADRGGGVAPTTAAWRSCGAHGAMARGGVLYMRSTYEKAQRAAEKRQGAAGEGATGGRAGCRPWAQASKSTKFVPRKARRAPPGAPSNAISREPLIARNGAENQARFEPGLKTEDAR